MSARRAQRTVANFDSASAMLRALGRFLAGKDFPVLSQFPKALEPGAVGIGDFVTSLPRGLREQVYTWSGWKEAIRKRDLKDVRSEQLAAWVVEQYPKKRYPAVLVGSANGAAIHLAAALGIPWLPQTLLIPVRRHGAHPDEPKQDLEQMIEPARDLLDANPELVLTHMHDANQDRLMVSHMTYFRVKRRRLGLTFERFLEEHLEPGGVIILVDCTLRWPGTLGGERHIFQHGALGGATAEEFERGGPRVAEYLERYGSHRRDWDYPATDGLYPEAEWGFLPELADDVTRFAREHGFRLRRLSFEQPEALSPVVADLYRDWHRRRRMPGNRLLVESFLLLEPYWTFVTGSVPFWMLFNKEPSAQAIHAYLDDREPFDEIFMTLFPHGVDSVGLVPISAWREVLARANKRGDFFGVDPETYPMHFSVLGRYRWELERKIHARYPLPGPLTFERVDAFLSEASRRAPISWGREGPEEGGRIEAGAAP